MLNVSLFLGFPINAFYQETLKAIDPRIFKIFIGEHQECYLRDVTFEGVFYLGKFLGEIIQAYDLLLLEKNIYSILKKMIPDHPWEDTPLVLFAAPPLSPI